MNVAKILLENGAEVNKLNHEGNAPLYFATNQGIYRVVFH